MLSTLPIACLCLLALSQAAPQPKPAAGAELEAQARTLVDKVNSAGAGWEAKVYPRFAKMNAQERKELLGLQIPKNLNRNRAAVEQEIPAADDIPAEFDPRKQWPDCADVINHIRDQSRCGDCWAVAAAGALSDRVCITSGGKVKLSVSDIDTASCAQKGYDGCQGAADLSPSWEFYQKTGVVSGGAYDSNEGCKPYPFPLSKDANRDYSTPRCTNRCSNKDYAKTYAQDKIFLDEPIIISYDNPKKVPQMIQREIMANGSVEVGFIVFTDFFYYSKGVYKHTWGSEEGGHAVRLIGWGVDDATKTPYWTVANSWNGDWGEQGFFRIRRGTDECYMESMVDAYSGNPYFKDT